MFHIRNNKTLPNIVDCKTWGEKARPAITPDQRVGDNVKSISSSSEFTSARCILGENTQMTLGSGPTSVHGGLHLLLFSNPLFICPHFWSSCRLQQTLSNIKTWRRRQQPWKAGQENTRATLKGHSRKEISKPQPGIFGLSRKPRCMLQVWDQALKWEVSFTTSKYFRCLPPFFVSADLLVVSCPLGKRSAFLL